MRGIVYQYDSYEALIRELDGGEEERTVTLAQSEGLRDGEWLLATFTVDEDSISVAACAGDRGGGPCLTVANRDWGRLRQFAEGHRPSLVPPSGARTSIGDVKAPVNASVLVVDDDDNLHHLLGSMLRSAGLGVGAASSAEEALDRMRERPIDLLVLDWNLPGMSGIEFCTRLRADPSYCRLPVLFLTARSCACDMVEAFAAGADDFVSKPFRGPELGARIISLLRRSQLASAVG